ncbi:hypothetical protein [Haloarchaeobius sp. DFWS5]|uniref:DUF7836 family putative zinc-binding protein n=1 Tax=Haloarchaeobius sp. DFWS5 TaxID=3446114 RepID=UPI003EB9CD3F
MRKAWIQLQCSACGETWESDPVELASPKTPFTCKHCGSERRLSEFAQTATDLKILRDFHAE